MVAILFFFVGSLLAGKAVALPELIEPKTITIDGNHIYITEMFSIFVYSLNDLKFQKKFGSKGEGPGEFRVNPNRFVTISVLPDSILVDSIGRITYFSKGGKYLKEMKAPLFGGVIPLGEKFVAYAPLTENGMRYVLISIFKAGQHNKLEKELDLFRFKHFVQRGNVKIDPVFFVRFPMIYTSQNKIFIDDGLEGEIFIFDSSGKQVNSIKLKYDKIPLKGKLKDEFIESFKINPEYKRLYERYIDRIELSSYLPKIRDYYVTDNKIYVLTNKRENGKGEFYVYDFNGKLLKHTLVPFKDSDIIEFYPYTIHDNKIYQMVESEDSEQWELMISDFK